jgi:uncharacterized protein YdeI (YjbR/CyaY-like superfamily)
LEFTSVAQIKSLQAIFKAYLEEAIAAEKVDLKIKKKKAATPLLAELKDVFKANPKVATAFYTLTPGRQRAYLLLFGSAKKSTTRLSRIKKMTPRILSGKGLNDR